MYDFRFALLCLKFSVLTVNFCREEKDNDVFKVLVLDEYAGRCLMLVRNIKAGLKEFEIWDLEKSSVGFCPTGSCIALYRFLIWKFSEVVKGKARVEVHYWLLLYKKFSRCIWTLPINFNQIQCENLKKITLKYKILWQCSGHWNYWP